jgi:hypothetical protein
LNHLLRLAFCASFLGLCFVGAFILRPVVLEELGLDFWELPHWQQTIDGELERAEGLSQSLDNSLRRHRAKDQICRDLVAGKLTLAAAVRQFGDLPDPPSYFREHMRMGYGGASAAETMGLHVIDWACGSLGNQPEKAGALRRRLEEELAKGRIRIE